MIQKERIKTLNKKGLKKGVYVLYLMQASEDASISKRCQMAVTRESSGASANRNHSKKKTSLKFRKQNRESLSTSLPVELEGKFNSIVSQAKGYWFFSFSFIDMGDGSSNGSDCKFKEIS